MNEKTLLNKLIKLFGSTNERLLKKYAKDAEPMNALEPTYEPMSNEDLRAQSDILRGRLESGETVDDILHDAFAVVREASKRALGMRPFDVQLIGGLVLHRGDIAEMKTGEGKTLVATLAVYLNALSGKGVHVVTVNDYLAQRDSEWMGKLYNFLGLTCGCIISDISDEQRRAAYNCDITYGTNNEFGFDYLRDNMKFSLKQMVQRPFNYAIVDEVDSILIDEARTPLIISGPSETEVDLYNKVDKIIPSLVDEDFEMDEKHKTIVLTDTGSEHVEELLREHKLLEEGSMYDMLNISLVHHANQALRAHKLFKADKDYIVKEDKIILIDEFTGRMMEGRRLSEGLHQAIEAKEGVEVQTENQTLASITYQNYFRLYPKLAGMTGTALTEAAEFQEIYNLGVVSIPTNIPVERLDYDDKIYRSLDDKKAAMVALVKECQERNQPVLVGTVSIEKSEELSAALKKAKVKHSVLNARYHEQEATIIAQAGRPGAVTIATNMAGRGTDIKLGGNLEMRIEQDGATTPEAITKIEEQIEADKQTVIKAGGLYVVGTERHESRRIDNQLRGRSGRQGDPGASMFFLSVEDDLMRIFAGDRLDSLLNNTKIGLGEGESLEHPMISKMLERAQGKVEGMHFEIRKNLLKFDDVMNDQRKVIYEQRREIMNAEHVEELAADMRHDMIEDLIDMTIPPKSYAEQWDIETLKKEALRVLALDAPVDEWAKEEGIADQEMLERLMKASNEKMAAKVANTGVDVWRQAEKAIMLQILDQLWKEHLLNLDHLRQGINLRAFGQRDPLNEYKTEAFGLFEGMLSQMRETITQTLSQVEINLDPDEMKLMMRREQDQPMQEGHHDPAMAGTAQNESAQVTEMPQRTVFDQKDPATWVKTPRNAACPCGSGKKYKQCHGSIKQRAGG